jgi:hypothetical protein
MLTQNENSLFFTFAVPVSRVVSLSITVESILGEEELSCLLGGHDVSLTCNVEGGYPRPVIIFKKDFKIIEPGEDQFFKISMPYSDQVCS